MIRWQNSHALSSPHEKLQVKSDNWHLVDFFVVFVND
jgi:hypothetical protein